MTDHEHTEPAPEEMNFLETLRITIQSGEEAFDAALAEAAGAENAERAPAVVSFETAAGLRQLLTDGRLELLRSLMADPAESISALADRLDRGYGPVHEDVETLAEYGIVRFRQAGQAKQPFVPYETIEFDVTVRAERTDGDTETAV